MMLNRRLSFAAPLAFCAVAGCVLDRSPILGSDDGAVGSGPCADITFDASPSAQFICLDKGDVIASWNAPALPVPTDGGGTSPGLVRTDVWTEPTDLTGAAIPSTTSCSLARRAAGECAFARYPASGTERFTPTGDLVLKYFSVRSYGTGMRSESECSASRPIKLVPEDGTRAPHVEEFPWVCDAASPSGRYATRLWERDIFATERVRNVRMVNRSDVPVSVGLRRLNRTTGIEEFIATSAPIPPDGELPSTFGGPSEGLWAVSTDLTRFGPTACPAPAPGSTAPPPPPGGRVPPTLRISFEFSCVTR
jgi:hypothetical protein